MTFRDRAVSTARDVLQVAFGPWPMSPAILFVAGAILSNYVVAGPYAGEGSPLTSQLALVPTTLISAVAITAPVWISNRVRRAAGRRLSRSWYLVTVALAGLAMGLSRPYVLTLQGFEVPFTVTSVFGFTVRGVLLTLIVFTLTGVTTSRIRRQAQRAEDALRQARESQVALVETEERVRANVSTFLHDRVQASLVALGLQLKYISQSADPETAQQLASLMEEVERIRTDDVRSAARLLSPDLETTSLVTVLRSLGATYEPAMRVDVSVVLTPEEQGGLAPGVALAIYRICEQALLNAAAHGRASHVAVSVSSDTDGLHLTVKDNGGGIGTGPIVRGTGSLVMDSWADLHGGSWTLRARDTRGASVHATFPRHEQV